MEYAYPAAPQKVPEKLTEPTAAYKRHAWLAMLLLSAFVATYVALSGWFLWTAYRLISGAFKAGNDTMLPFAGGVAAAFLAVFMLKALFFVKHRYEIDDLEITSEQEPRLFAFLNRLADDAHAPRAHRVFLSSRVNAAVFYDLSILNLILPSKKNLEIGLPLVNVLSLGEFKAVLAHEFGHFAQRSMAVGRWVYVAQQIAGHLISTRDVLDRFLAQLSRVDIRIAWIGWILSLIVWSIRSIMETLFRLVILAQLALSREMEFQADLVSVSLTGSDALIHALHRLQAAEDAWDRALNFAAVEAQKGKPVLNLFAVQDRIIRHIRTIFGKPDYGLPPARPEKEPEKHRLFKRELAQTPRMWSTHPSNNDRESNAKRAYISAEIDSRPVWELFQDAAGIQARMSSHVFKTEVAPAPLEESLRSVDAQYERAYLRPQYRGVYLGRSVVRHAAHAEELYLKEGVGEDVLAALDSLYPISIGAELERVRELDGERAALEALRTGAATAPGGVLQHRGRQLRRSDLPRVIAELDQEIQTLERSLQAHDNRCRTAHLAAARNAGSGWEEYLRGLLGVLHYADHSAANLRDVRGYFSNVFSVVTADGRVSVNERDRLIAAANQIFYVLEGIYGGAGSVSLDPTILQQLETETWVKLLGEFQLVRASPENISQWLEVIDGWINSTASALVSLQFVALNQLLLGEAQVAGFLRQGQTPHEAPGPSTAPAKYATLTPGNERALQTKLDLWTRFQVADGMGLTLARLAVAGAIIAGVLWLGSSTGQPDLLIYNGLNRTVNVTVGSSRFNLPPLSKRALPASSGIHVITSTTDDGQAIESFQANIRDGFVRYVYNIAGASPLVEWTAVYGNATARPERHLGAPRWTTTSADVLFAEPPARLETKSGGGTRDVLSGTGGLAPHRVVAGLKLEHSAAVTSAHARWDDLRSRYIMQWLTMAGRDAGSLAILQTRLKETPRNPLLLRLEQDLTPPESRAAVCQRHTALFEAQKDADLQYVIDRCVEPASARDRAFLQHYQAAPQNPWLALAAGYTLADHGQWAEAAKALEVARKQLPETTEFVALDLARVRRVMDGEKATLVDILRDSEQLRDLVQLGSGQDVTGSYLAYQSLASGRLDEASQRSLGSPLVQSEISLFVAASEGANPDLATKALARSLTDVTPSGHVWYLLGLAARQGVNTAPYRDLIVKREPGLQQLASQFDGQARINPGLLETQLKGVGIAERGYVYAAAVIAMGVDAPAGWRENARRLLFPAERPFF